MKYNMIRIYYFFLLFFIFNEFFENYYEIKVLGNKRITSETIFFFQVLKI